MAARGTYIVIEGIDGAGKTTQHERLLGLLPKNTLNVREPGGTPLAENLRTIIKDKSIPRSPEANVFLFAAARADVLQNVIRPALAEGRHVVSDRSWLSSVAYQYAEGARTAPIIRANKLAAGDLFTPDLLIFIDADPAICAERLRTRGLLPGDFFDTKGLDYFKKVRAAYLRHTARIPTAHIVDGNKTPDEVFEQITRIVKGAGL